MTPRNRLSAAFSKEPVDRVPIIIPGGMMAGVLYEILSETSLPYPEIHTIVEHMVAYTNTLQQKCGLDNTGVPFCMTVEAEDFGAKIDLGSALYEPSVSSPPCSTLEDLINSTPQPSSRHQTVLKAIQKLSGGDIPVVGNVIGPMSLLTSLVPQGVVFRAMEKDKENLQKSLQKVGQHIAEFAEEQIEAGADVIVVADPSATGDIIGPLYFSEFMVPAYDAIINRLKKFDRPIVLHICGRIQSLIPGLKKLDWDGLSVDSLVGMNKLKEPFAGRVLMGNVSTQIMAMSGEEKTYRTSRRIVETVAILAPACGLSTKTPINNIKSMKLAAEDAANGLKRSF